MKKKAIVLWLINLLIFANLQAQVTCTATAPAKVGINQTFQYNVKINQKATPTTGKTMGAFSIVGGPSQSYSSSTSIINGQVSSSTEYTYTYVLQPTKLRQHTIPGATFTVNGKSTTANSVSIVVTQENQQTQQSGRRSNPFSFFDEPAPTRSNAATDVFLKAYASTTTPYEGQEVIITHKIYLGSGIYDYQITKNNLPSQAHLWSYTLGDTKSPAKQSVETINGKKYNVYEIRTTAVFPQKSGEIIITPLEFEGIATISSGFWASQKEIKVKSNSVKLQVKPLPTNGKPDNFSGLVGNFTIKSSLTKSSLTTNDATDLLVTISGSGNLQHVENLNFAFPTDFDVADPTLVDKINTLGKSVSGSRSFDYVIIPRAASKFIIQGTTFSYFDLKTNTYKTLTTEPFTIEVEKGADGNNTSNSTLQKDIQVLDKDIRYIKDDPNAFAPKTGALFGTPIYLILLFTPFLLVILFFIILRKYLNSRKDVAQLRNRRANKVATKRLKKAHKLLLTNKKEEFYIEISRALWGYVSDKYHIPQSELSMDTVRAKLEGKNVDNENIERLINTLNECEFARFAPNNNEELMNHLYNLSIDYITIIEKK